MNFEETKLLQNIAGSTEGSEIYRLFLNFINTMDSYILLKYV